MYTKVAVYATRLLNLVWWGAGCLNLSDYRFISLVIWLYFMTSSLFSVQNLLVAL